MRLYEIDAQLSKIQNIAEEFRDWIEDKGYNQLCTIEKPTSITYSTFAGMCNKASRMLAEIYKKHGYPAETRFFQYQLSDFEYWETHGRAFYQSDEDFEDGEAFEFGEDHEVVVIGNIIVDVTSDQFNPSDPSKHRVVVTTTDDRRYE
jgi:hypothetical protein